MAGKRAKDRTNITAWIRRDLLLAMERAREITGETRTEFMLNAIADRLEKYGFHVDREWIRPPDRARKKLIEIPAELLAQISTAIGLARDESPGNPLMGFILSDGKVNYDSNPSYPVSKSNDPAVENLVERVAGEVLRRLQKGSQGGKRPKQPGGAGGA